MSSASESADAMDRANTGGGKPILARQRAKEEAEAQGRQAPKFAYFPLGYREGFSQWWSSLAPAVTEHTVLSFIPHLQRPPTHLKTGAAPAGTSATTSRTEIDEAAAKSVETVRTNAQDDPYGPRQWQSRMIQLSGKDRSLNEFSVERIGEEVENDLVMLHGYGAGLGFFYKNFESLSRLPHWRLYALDMLGMGRSSRPPFRIHAKDKEGRAREAESWFVDALEEWRKQKGIEKMTLLGHSLGGYMAVCYALKYPGHLHKLILASPVGIPEDPYATNEDLPEPNDSTLANEFTQDQDDTTRPSASAASKDPPRKPLPRWLRTLWDANISPFSLVRLAGPLGPRLVSGWTSRRFSHLPSAESEALHDYSYSLFRQPGSGEYALAHVLAPGAYARSPLIRRISGVGRQYLDSASPPPAANGTPASATSTTRLRETGIPVVLMYGDHDWMDVTGGHDSVARMAVARARALEEGDEGSRRRENGDAKVTIIRDAGHHVYLDGWEQFNREILAEMRDVEVRRRRLAAADR